VSKVLCFLASSLALLLAAPALATVQRAHVSAAFGVDSNTIYNCDAVHPCRFFQTATTVVSSGGEVVALDSGGYGTVNITQSISLIAPAGVYAGISVFAGANGININTAGVNVTLRGLTINGMGGDYGVSMDNGAQLSIENSTIAGFPGYGALYIGTPARVFVKDSAIKDSDSGIQVGYGATLNISNTSLTGMAFLGVLIAGGPAGTTTTVIASDTLISCVPASNSYGFDNYAPTGSVGKMFLTRVTVSSCGNGVYNLPATIAAENVISISNSMLTSNSTGMLNATGTTILSSGNNHIVGNATDIVGTITTGTMLH
jgi:hypothetical protein